MFTPFAHILLMIVILIFPTVHMYLPKKLSVYLSSIYLTLFLIILLLGAPATKIFTTALFLLDTYHLGNLFPTFTSCHVGKLSLNDYYCEKREYGGERYRKIAHK